MSKNTSTSAGDQSNDVVTRYESGSGVGRAGLRLLKECDAKVAALRAALSEAEQSGEPELFDFHEFVREQRAMDDR